MLLSAEHGVFFGGAGVSTDSGLAVSAAQRAGSTTSPAATASRPRRYSPPPFTRRHPRNFSTTTVPAAQPRRAAQQRPPHPRGAGGAGAHKVRHHPERGQPAPARWEPERHRHPRATSTSTPAPLAGKRFPPEAVADCEGVPRCDVCGGIIRPGILLFGEIPDMHLIMDAIRELKKRGPANNRRHLPQGQQRAAPARPLPRAHGHNKRRAHAL